MRRRYSEFSSLRDALTRLHPTLIIPPIPEKHTMADYAANPTNAKQDQQIIDLRKRMLAVFLNRCRRMNEVRTDGIWWRFLDPNASWVSWTLKLMKKTYSNVASERGSSFSSYCVDSKSNSQSPSSGHRKPNTSSQFPSYSLCIGKAEDSCWSEPRYKHRGGSAGSSCLWQISP